MEYGQLYQRDEKRTQAWNLQSIQISMDTQVLKMVLEHASKMPFSKFLEKHVWNKVGVESDATILMDNEVDRAELAFGILAMTTEMREVRMVVFESRHLTC